MPKGKALSKTYLVEVMPISKGGTQGLLSYFSSIKILPGTLVKVPLRNSLTTAVVLNTKSAVSAKSDIRRASYALKKIARKDIFAGGLSSAFLSAVQETATYYATTPSALLLLLLPKMLLEEPELWTPGFHRRKPGVHHKETFLLQVETEERFGQYRALVRQCFARKTSVMFVVPTHLDAVRARGELSHGIAEFVYLFSLQEKKVLAKKTWTRAISEKHPVLFITTPAGVSFHRQDLETIIVERENSRAYRTLTRPYIHLKTFLEILTRKTGRQLVLGDSVLSLETLWKEKNQMLSDSSVTYSELSLIRWRLSAAPATLVDAKSQLKEKGKFEIFTPELKALIARALQEKQKIFLFGARKGLAPTTVCGDCGFILPCLNCGAPVVLHGKTGSSTTYLCHACGSHRDSTTLCGYCGSWKLTALGIGTEKIAAEARELFPEASVAILDKDHAPTDAKARVIVKKFVEEGQILVGTELAFFHLEKVPYSALVSVDSLFSIPDFGISERIFYLVSRLREMTQHEVIVQTRNIGKQILAWASQGNIIDFYQSEMAERQELLYPPFSIFIKVTGIMNKELGIRNIKERFLKWQPDVLKDSLILRIPRENWPDEELSSKLSLLGREFSIKVDPESIL
ncbi:MAG: hypothetical protein Q7R67_00705 [bacterium]|nr:hypothetical protein [bacterium]